MSEESFDLDIGSQELEDLPTKFAPNLESKGDVCDLGQTQDDMGKDCERLDRDGRDAGVKIFIKRTDFRCFDD
jgi:hypothetical protein